jgi:hypothetical protein
VTLSRSGRVLAVAIAALSWLLAAYAAPARAATDVLPDLVADPPANPLIQTYAHPDGTTHLLLRFDGYIHNRGLGAVEIRGSQPVGTAMTLTAQRVYRDDATYSDDASRHPQIVWEPADGHNHWHLKNAARYSLWSSDQTAEVAPAMKAGFCLVDSQRIETYGPSSPRYASSSFCGRNQPTLPSIVEGVSAGWRDFYERALAYQWVDITNVQPGVHWLRSDVDPDNYVRESNEANSGTFAGSSTTISGYRAKPVDAGVVSTTAPTTIPFATDSFGSGLGARAFRIIVSPKHGRLNVGGGSLFSTPSVTYTPSPGWVGPDSFTYEAHDGSSSFPSYPATAAVTLNVGGISPNVAISGAPASLLAGTSARLLATVIGEDPFVHWSVDGVYSGTAATGTVDSWGLYRAPPQAPASGQVTIRATTASGVFAEVTIVITNPPPPQPAPTIESRSVNTPPVESRVLRGVRLGTDGQAIIVQSGSKRAGVVRIRMRNRDRMLGRCRALVQPARAVICRAPLHGMWPGGTRAAITLRVNGRLVDVLRMSLSESIARAELEALHRK